MKVGNSRSNTILQGKCGLATAFGLLTLVGFPSFAAEVAVDFADRIGSAGDGLYGGFVEHLGRNVYGGVYDPKDPTADADGFRRDVIAEMKELRTSVIRYPGGCFTDFWCWEDGIGPREKRPVRIDPYWQQLEDNSFGLDDFLKWIDKVGARPMITINLSTRGLLEAARMWEYLRFPKGTTLSEMRRSNGRADPYPIRYWCLGNELHGHWEYGHREPERYGRDARDVAKFLKKTDRDAVTILCGSEYNQHWNEVVLERAWEWTDMLSIHMPAWQNREDFLRSGDLLGQRVRATAETIAKVNARQPQHLRKNVGLCVDEYFIWDNDVGARGTEYTKGRHILEPNYTQRDAVVLGDLLIALHNNSDVVRFACIAQSVNAIAPVRTEPNGRLWHQSIYDPLRLTSRFGRGVALRPRWTGGTVADLRASAIWNEKSEELALFAVNRSTENGQDLVLSVDGAWRVAESWELSSPPMARNGLDREEVRARKDADAVCADGRLKLKMKPCSWRMVVLRMATGKTGEK